MRTQTKTMRKEGWLGMGLKFYIASAWGNKAQVRELAGRLIAAGGVWTFDWTRLEKSGCQTFAAACEINAVREADIVFVLLPGGLGTHTEMGAALALGKKVYLYAEDRNLIYDESGLPQCVFYEHPGITMRFSQLPFDEFAGIVTRIVAEDAQGGRRECVS